MAFVGMSGMSIAAIGTEVSAIMVGAGLLFFGFGAGAWDVAMNVEAAAVEQGLERSIMSRFHAAFSVGTVAGALGRGGHERARRRRRSRTCWSSRGRWWWQCR